MTLYHYTCEHSAPRIERDGFIVPGALLAPGGDRLAWFTDLQPPNRLALGLTSYMLKCDRLACMFAVAESPDIMRWVKVRRNYPDMLIRETAPGVLPMHWWVSEVPVPIAALQPRYKFSHAVF